MLMVHHETMAGQIGIWRLLTLLSLAGGMRFSRFFEEWHISQNI